MIEAYFKNAKSVHTTLQMDPVEISSDHVTATVTGQMQEQYTPKNGDVPPARNEDIRFTLKKNNGVTSRLVQYLFGLCLTLSAVSQTLPSLKPSLDVAQFQDKTQRAYLEIYYALPAAAIKYVPANSGKELVCQLLLSLQVYRDRTLWASKVWKIEKSHPDTLPPLARPQQLVDVVSYLLDAPGQYRMTLLVKDMHQPDRLLYLTQSPSLSWQCSRQQIP